MRTSKRTVAGLGIVALTVGIGALAAGRLAAATCKPITDLTQCQNRTQNPDFDVEADINGCGPPSPFGNVLPDTFAGVSFDADCRAHDRCYDTCNSVKLGCDMTLRAGLRNACVGKLRGRDNMDALQWCLQWADSYGLFVHRFGQKSYNDSQKQACCCSATTSNLWCNCTHKCYQSTPTCQEACRVTLGCFVAICAPADAGQCP